MNLIIRMHMNQPGFNLMEHLLEMEKNFILEALELAPIKAEACKLLGMNRTTLVEKCRRHGLLKKKKP